MQDMVVVKVDAVFAIVSVGARFILVVKHKDDISVAGKVFIHACVHRSVRRQAVRADNWY